MVALVGSVALGLAVTLVLTGALAFVAKRVWGAVDDDEQVPDREATRTA